MGLKKFKRRNRRKIRNTERRVILLQKLKAEKIFLSSKLSFCRLIYCSLLPLLLSLFHVGKEFFFEEYEVKFRYHYSVLAITDAFLPTQKKEKMMDNTITTSYSRGERCDSRPHHLGCLGQFRGFELEHEALELRLHLRGGVALVVLHKLLLRHRGEELDPGGLAVFHDKVHPLVETRVEYYFADDIADEHALLAGVGAAGDAEGSLARAPPLLGLLVIAEELA